MRRGKGCLIAAAVAVLVAIAVLAGGYLLRSSEAAQNTSAMLPNAVDAAPSAVPTKVPVQSEYCADIEEPATPEACERYRQIHRGLDDGAAAFNAPSVINRGATVRVRFAVDRQANSTGPAAAVEALPGETIKLVTKVGRYMRAELSGDGFRVVGLNPASQDLFTSDSAIWEWDVTAVSGGDRVLSLKTWVEARGPDGALRPRWLKVEDRAIKVEVPWQMRLSDGSDTALAWFARGSNLLKAVAALVVAAGALWLAIKQFGKPSSK